MPISRYYSSALSEDDNKALIRGDMAIAMSQEDVDKHLEFSKLLLQPYARDKHTGAADSDVSPEPQPPRERRLLRPVSWMGKGGQGRRVMSTPPSRPSRLPSYTPAVPSPLAGKTKLALQPKGEVTFDDFLAPHTTGKGEAYRGAENALSPEEAAKQHELSKRRSMPLLNGVRKPSR